MFQPLESYTYFLRYSHVQIVALGLGNIRIKCKVIPVFLGEIGWGGLDWIGLAQDGDQWRALANDVMNLRVL
jgi:hypothetical protein